LTPDSPRRRFPTHFLRPRAVKNALTRPTLSYMANALIAPYSRLVFVFGKLPYNWLALALQLLGDRTPYKSVYERAMNEHDQWF
jgi:hypothetical protein